MTILDQIVAVKREEAAALRRARPGGGFDDVPGFHLPVRSLRDAIVRARRPAVIAEIKRSSPSAGVIRGTADPAGLAAAYASNGASAVSVLTDVRFFSGSPGDLAAVRAVSPVPVLRKDFLIEEIQVAEAKSLGADAILLIASILDAGRLRDLHGRAAELGMECLVEVHRPEELEMIDFSVVRVVGINNRNLGDFSVDLETTARVGALLPRGVVTVSESGLRSAADVRRVAGSGVDAVLMGEYFMRDPEPGRCLRAMIDELRQD